MRATKVLNQVLHHLVPLCILSLAYLYLYPIFHGCSFPVPRNADGRPRASTWFLGPFGHQQKAAQSAVDLPPVAPFRLLALGDPQLEGDSSLPDINKNGEGVFPSIAALQAKSARGWSFEDIRQASWDLLVKDIPRLLEYGHKWLDLLGNDFYLAHIYRTTHAWTKPTHVVVLGDLLGSQWVSDEEFRRRSERFWTRVFRGGSKASPSTLNEGNWSSHVLAVAGNHDIGYAGDIDAHRIERFEEKFGLVNWQVQLSLTSDGSQLTNNVSASQPSLRLIMLNSMNLDTPAKSPDLQSRTYDFLNDAISSSQPLRDSPGYGDDATVLLTHIPLHKPAGICADGPHFDFFPGSEGGGVKEQNHLSEHVSQSGILEGLYGMKGNQKHGNLGIGRNGIILTGHDHEGCDVWHFWNRSSLDQSSKETYWTAARTDTDEAYLRRSAHAKTLDSPSETDHVASQPGIREITVRSMMGEFGGNAGLLSAWFDADAGRWRFEYSSCSLGVQHVWWAIHIVVLVTLGIALSTLIASTIATRSQPRRSNGVPDRATAKENDSGGWTPDTSELSVTPQKEGLRPATPSLNRSQSKRIASEVMKQRRERYQRSLKGRREVDGASPQSDSTTIATSRLPADKDWEIVDSDATRQ